MQSRYDAFSLKNFRLTVPKKFVEEPFRVSENFCYRKKNMDKRGGGGRGREGVSLFPVKKFLSHGGERFRRGTL